MKILAAECSATPVSCAISVDGKIIEHSFANLKITHSQTLLPKIAQMLKKAGLKPADIDCFAVSAGPGSFTGVRIGISAIKGLATPTNAKCVGVSTLLAMAYNYIDTDCIVCAVMDARCNQVYNALFQINGGVVTRLTPDRALMCDELILEIKEKYSDKKVIIVGDGTYLFHNAADNNIILSEEERRYQNAVGVILAAGDCEAAVTPDKLLPTYLRLPQAERELKLKQERGN